MKQIILQPKDSEFLYAESIADYYTGIIIVSNEIGPTGFIAYDEYWYYFKSIDCQDSSESAETLVELIEKLTAYDNLTFKMIEFND